MPYIVEIPNYFDHKTAVKHVVPLGSTIKEWLDRDGKEWVQFELPTLVQINGNDVMQKEYPLIKLKKGDIVTVTVLLGDPVTLIVAVLVAVVAAVVATTFAQQPKAIGETQEGDTVYSLKGQTNANKLGQPIPDHMGRIRNWPDLAAASVSYYSGNDQFQTSLYCIGKGEYDVSLSDMYFSNTPISEFEDVEVEVVPPQGSVTLFRTGGQTIAEVNNIELHGPNEDDYDGFKGNFAINDIGTEINRIEVDLVYSGGLYYSNDNGGFNSRVITTEFQYRQIDDNGNAVIDGSTGTTFKQVVRQTRNSYNFRHGTSYGDWETVSNTKIQESHNFANGTTVTNTISSTIREVVTYTIVTLTGGWNVLRYQTHTLATNTTQRFTYAVGNLSPGRYEVRAIRRNNKDESSRAVNTATWESTKGFHVGNSSFGNVTVIAVKALATNNLNDSSARKFNLYQTRKLETWNEVTETWNSPTATRNPVDQAIHIFRCEHGGRRPDSFFDFPKLMEIRSQFAANGVNCDYSFQNATNCWDAARLVLAVGRAIPVMNGSKLSLAVDDFEETPSAIFTPNNIIKGSIEWNMGFRKDNDPDGLEIKFTDEETWKPRTLLCLVGDDQGLNPSSLEIKGITNADKAYQEGLHIRAKAIYMREEFTFSTGLEGHIPNVNSLIGVSHGLKRDSVSGFVETIESQLVILNKEVLMEAGKNYSVYFRSKLGNVLGPYAVLNEETSTDRISILEAFDSANMVRTQYQEPVIFVFGEVDNSLEMLRVVSITPKDNDEIKINCVNNDNRVYGIDDTAPINEVEIQESEIPFIDNLQLTQEAGEAILVVATWTLSNAANSYQVEYSYDNETFTLAEVTLSNSSRIEGRVGSFWVRVRGIGVFTGSTVTENILLVDQSEPPSEVSNLRLLTPFTGTAARLAWDVAAGASSYLLRVLKGSDSSQVAEIEISGTSHDYSYEEAITDFSGTPERNLKFNVATKNTTGVTEPSTELDITNPLAAVPANISITEVSVNSTTHTIQASFDAVNDTDIKEYIIWASDTQGFTETDPLIVARGLFNTVTFDILNTGLAPTYYARVAALDHWGNGYNLSAEIAITLS